MATLDSRTSAVCQQLDGQEFPVSDAQAGVNLPPMHAHCRSTTISVISEKCLENLERRAKNPDGTTSKVPADMSYKEWQENQRTAIDKSAKSDIINKTSEKITDYNSAKKVLESRNVIFDSSLKNIDEKCLVCNAERLDYLINKFSAAQKYINENKFTFKAKNMKSIGSCSYNYSGSSQTISLGINHYLSAESYIEQQKRRIESGFKMSVAEENLLNYTINHEFGHFIENIIIHNMKESKGFAKVYQKASKANSSEKFKKIINKWYDKRAYEIEKEIAKIAHSKDKRINVINYKKFVSRYGKQSSQEFFAEIFANSQGGNPNILGEAMNDYLERVFK